MHLHFDDQMPGREVVLLVQCKTWVVVSMTPLTCMLIVYGRVLVPDLTIH